MKVSVIIPVYNVSEYIEACLDSVGIQDYQNIECVLVDDCGTDDSMQKAEAWIKHYKGNVQFRILHQETNQGVAVARNTGLEAATGEYIVFVDSDDTLYSSSSISSLTAAVEQYPDAELIIGNLDSNEKKFCNYFGIQDETSCTTAKEIDKIISERMCPWARIIKRSFLIDNNIKFPEGFAHEDNLWSFHIAQKATKVITIRDKVYYYNVRAESETTGALNEERRVRSLFLTSIEILSSENSHRYFDFFAFYNLIYIARKDDDVLEKCGCSYSILNRLHSQTVHNGNFLYSFLLLFYTSSLRKKFKNRTYLHIVLFFLNLFLLRKFTW